jgi:hypothetical protein
VYTGRDRVDTPQLCVCVCVCAREFLAHIIYSSLKQQLYGFGAEKKVIELADQRISLKKTVKHSNESLALFLLLLQYLFMAMWV